MESDERVIKTHVWHEGECFFVSTIERDSSAMLGPRRYNEIMVWRYDWARREVGTLVSQDECSVGSIHRHQQVVQLLFDGGAAALAREAEDL